MSTQSKARATHCIDEEAPVGVYYLRDVSRYLYATDFVARGKPVTLSPQRITGWGRRGLLGVNSNQFERNRSFVEFPHLITSRMVALLLSYGIAIRKIVDAHDFVKKETKDRYPFATRMFWTEEAEFPRHIYTKINDILITADEFGQMPFTELLEERIIAVHNMGFDESGLATYWEPIDGVMINPAIHSGTPCIKGTRIATALLHAMYLARQSIESLMEWYSLKRSETQAAIDWESALIQTESKRIA